MSDENRVLQLERELAITKLRFKQLANNVDQALWEMTVDPKDPANPDVPFWFSDRYRKMLGFNDESDFPNVLGSWVDRLHPEDAQTASDAFDAFLLDKSGRTPYNIRYRLQKKDGEFIWVHEFGVMARLPDGEERAFGIAEDITHRLKKDELEKYIVEFTDEIDSLRKSVTQIMDSAASLKQTQKMNLEHSTEAKENAEKTRDILKGVQNIAMQSNMLALNASIEAARAGVSGRGFAVVAEEVGNLAKKSKESASQMETRVNAIEETSMIIIEDNETTVDLTRTLEASALDVKSMVDGLVKTYKGLTNLIEASVL
jgi:PAS domain S-box-containing protein